MPKAPRAPAFVVHDLPQALAVFAAAQKTGRAMRIESAVGAAGFAGAGFWTALIAAAREAYPKARVTAVLDCGAEPGLALAAIRAGAEAIRCRARKPVRDKLAAIARRAKVRFIDGPRGTMCELLNEADPAAAVAACLAPATARKSRAPRGAAAALKKSRSSAIPGGKTKPHRENGSRP